MQQIKFETVQQLKDQLKPGHQINTIRHDTINGQDENGDYTFVSKDEGLRTIIYVNQKAIGVKNQFNTTDLTTWINWPKSYEAQTGKNQIEFFTPGMSFFSNLPEIIITYKFYEQT